MLVRRSAAPPRGRERRGATRRGRSRERRRPLAHAHDAPCTAPAGDPPVSSGALRRAGLAAATVLISVALCVAAGELLLRAAGRGPLAFRGAADAPPFYQPHPSLGWEHVPGRFRVGGAPATFLPDGSRRAAAAPPPPGPALVLVGGSFTEGYGVRDEETFAWRLQERLPDRVVRNLGTGGHGTLQALEMLRIALPRLEEDPGVTGLDAVVYGFMWHHPLRNVAHADWRKQLNDQSRGTEGAPVRVPYALLDARGALVRHAPEPWPLLGPSTRSALVHVLTEQWVRLTTRDRGPQAFRVTLALLTEMDALVRAHGGRLLVAALYAPPQQTRPMRRFLAGRGVAFVDCTLPDYGDPTLRDPDTGHPTPRAHARYAACIAGALDDGTRARDADGAGGGGP